MADTAGLTVGTCTAACLPSESTSRSAPLAGLDTHVVVGVRKWWVENTVEGLREHELQQIYEADTPDNCGYAEIYVWSVAYERVSNLRNRVGFAISGIDTMYDIWKKYLTNIADDAMRIPQKTGVARVLSGADYGQNLPFHSEAYANKPDWLPATTTNPWRADLPTRLGGSGTGKFDPLSRFD